MPKPYEKPTIDELQTPEVEPVKDDVALTQTVIAGVAAKTVPNDLTSIYKERIVLFRKFIAGEFAANNLEERAEEQAKFITFFSDMLNAEYPVMSACMDAMVKEINDYPNVLSEENIRAPYWVMKKKPNIQVAAPYFAFLTFITSLAANIQRRGAFIKGIDVTSFLSHWNEKQKKNLDRYIHD